MIVDEAGHAVEPELLIGVAGILNADPHVPGGCGQLVLAGDPQQLGPVLRSPFAIKYGLGMIQCLFVMGSNKCKYIKDMKRFMI